MSLVSITASVHYIKEMAEGVRDGEMKINLFGLEKGGEPTLFGYRRSVKR